MFKNLKAKCALVLLSMTPLSAFAHAGHDHQSSWAFLIHAVWLAPIILATYIAVNLLKKKKSTLKGK